jgi:hypothetical protein
LDAEVHLHVSGGVSGEHDHRPSQPGSTNQMNVAITPDATYWPFSPGAATQTRVPMRMLLCPRTWMRAALKIQLPKLRVPKLQRPTAAAAAGTRV